MFSIWPDKFFDQHRIECVSAPDILCDACTYKEDKGRYLSFREAMPGIVKKVKMVELGRLWRRHITGNPRFVIRPLKQWDPANHIPKRLVSSGQPG